MYNRTVAGKRVLGRVRLSRLSEESTSSARQRQIIEDWASANDHEVVGWAEDLDVSGSVDPFDTPEFGQWMKQDRQHEWDTVVAWKLDRFGRDAIRLNKLFGWCVDNGKTLVSASEGIDLATPVGRLIANVIAFLAEGELEAIRERTKASRQALLALGRWPGGRTPYGFRPVEHPDGGWKLGIEPSESRVVERIVSEILDGAAVEAVVDRLNEDGIPAPRGGVWHHNTVWRIAQAKYLLGHATYDGQTVRDAKGQPVLYAEPMLTREKWDAVQRALELRKTPESSKRTRNTSPLLGVAECLECGAGLVHRTYYRDTGKKVYRYYHCPNKHFPQIPSETVEELVEQTFLEEVGDHPVQERVYVPREDHQAELDEAVRAVDELTSLLGTITSDTMRSRLTGQLSALDSRISELEKLPTSEAHWEYRQTDETYADAWEAADTEARRQLLLRSGITACIKLVGKTRTTPGGLEFELRVPPNVRELLTV